jgi:diguanylate cyclase (GGDEF)-like protein
LGGEEFGVLLPDTDLAGATTVAERIRAAIEAARVPGGEPDEQGERPDIRVTVSLGVAELRADEPFESLLKRADRALYAAKDLGRNRVQA